MPVVAKVDDVAAAVLKRAGAVTAMKLQKLAYYAQAWHLVWESRPLFRARIEAWANGPVVPALYRRHRGQLIVDSWPYGEPSALAPSEQSTIDAVVDFYGDMTPVQLSDLTHREAPWRDARLSEGLAPGERGRVEISNAAMVEYYESLVAADSTT